MLIYFRGVRVFYVCRLAVIGLNACESEDINEKKEKYIQGVLKVPDTFAFVISLKSLESQINVD
jgi:hypothetical protein